jgi:hypothetical protein
VQGALPEAPGVHRGGERKKWPVVAGVAVIAAAAMLGYALTRPVVPPRVLRTVELTNTNRPKSGIVTDGARLYFIESQSILSQTSVTGGETFAIPTSLENTGFANVFDISADGSALLMNTAHGTSLDGPLWSVPVLGGSPRRLGTLEGHAGRGRGWEESGVPQGNEIGVARSDGGEPHRVLTTAGTPSDIRWSPDGSILRFTLNDRTDE